MPVPWDKAAATDMTTESADILRRVTAGVGSLAFGPDLYPAGQVEKRNAPNEAPFSTFNNRVYRAGFGMTQVACEETFAKRFETLDKPEAPLSDRWPA